VHQEVVATSRIIRLKAGTRLLWFLEHVKIGGASGFSPFLRQCGVCVLYLTPLRKIGPQARDLNPFLPPYARLHQSDKCFSWILARSRGIEPLYAILETAVLPLN